MTYDSFVRFITQAQVVSSDALKNVPFFLITSTGNQSDVDFTPNDTYAKKCASAGNDSSRIGTNVVKIPKDILGFVTVGKYRISQSMEHMPLVRKDRRGQLITSIFVFCLLCVQSTYSVSMNCSLSTVNTTSIFIQCIVE